MYADTPSSKWALALGTPVLVVAGFGHVIPILFHKAARKLKVKHKERRMSRSVSRDGGLTQEKTNASSASTLGVQRSRASSATPPPKNNNALQVPGLVTFEIDVGGNDEVVSKWPSFVRMENGKALIQATMKRDDYDLEAQRPGPSRVRS
jgi:hypothetical protein